MKKLIGLGVFVILGTLLHLKAFSVFNEKTTLDDYTNALIPSIIFLAMVLIEFFKYKFPDSAPTSKYTKFLMGNLSFSVAMIIGMISCTYFSMEPFLGILKVTLICSSPWAISIYFMRWNYT